MTVTQVKFATKTSTDFVNEMKERVEQYFVERGLSDKANAAMVIKTFVMLGVTFGCYGLILSNRFSPLAMLGLAIVMGVGLAGIGFAVSHDALHGAYSHDPRINRLIGFTFDILGANSYMWKITHNVIHHTYTNIHGIDEDLAVSPMIRLSPRSAWHPIHRVQHWLAFFLYSFSTLFWVFVKDYKYFFQRDLGPYKDKKHPASEWVILVVGKLFYYSWAIVLPLMVITVVPWWQVLLGYVAMNATAGLILGVVFQLAHVVEGPEHPAPDCHGCMCDAWAVHQLQTTSNFATGNRLLSWYVGGLNYQVEHHLFPRTCSVHYPAITAIVRDVARKYGVVYHVQPTLWSAIRSHYRTLKKHADPAYQLA